MSFDDDEEALFEKMLQCCPCRVDDAIPMQGATPVEAEDEEDLFDAYLIENVASMFQASISETAVNPSVTQFQGCPRNAFGVHRKAESTPSLESCTDSKYDYRSVESENHAPNKITIVRGKPERKRTKIKQEIILIKTEKALETTEIAAGLVPCCKSKCNIRFTFDDVKVARTHFWSLTRSQQQDHLVRELSFWGRPNAKQGVFNFEYFVNEKKCCAAFLEQALPVSHGRLVDCRKRVLNKDLADSTKASSPSNCPIFDRMAKFICEYAEAQSGAMPTLDKKTELPSGTTKDSVYMEYLLSYTEEETQNMSMVGSLSTWYRTWSTEWPTIKANNRANRFSKCTKCSNLKILKGLTTNIDKGENSCYNELVMLELILA